MKRNQILRATLCGWAAAAALAVAADLAQPRIWTSLSGKELPAVFVRLSGDSVVLRDRAGTLTQIPRAKLSLADQALLDESFGAVAAAPAVPALPEAPATPPAPPPATDGATGATSPPPYTGGGSYDSLYPRGATDEEKALIDSPKFDLVPSKWFNHFKDHEELVELQKQTGACMLVYFKNLNASDEKGLCGWFEKDIANSPEWRKAMKNYLKIEITIAGGNDELEALVAKYRVKKTPAIYVVKPGTAYPQRISVFEWTDKKPEPLDPEVVVESLKTASTPAYQTLF